MNYKARVFLSGGFRSNWQSEVIKATDGKFIFFNPREHGLENSDFYTSWDIHFIKECDIFFAYMESSNPSGYGLAFELGVAYALNKTIILVDQKSMGDKQFEKYFRITHSPSGVVLSDLKKGIDFLNTFSIKSSLL
jgi:nucleoside 2-deoxyribosyltransferase